MSAHYMHALEIEASLDDKSLSDMERQEYIEALKAQKEVVEQLKSILSFLKESVALKDKEITELTSKVGELTRALSDAMDRINYLSRQLYGKSTQSNRHKVGDKEGSSRQEEENDYDGSDNGATKASNKKAGKPKSGKQDGATSSTEEKKSSSLDTPLDGTKVSSEYLNSPRGKRGKYTLMDAANVV